MYLVIFFHPFFLNVWYDVYNISVLYSKTYFVDHFI